MRVSAAAAAAAALLLLLLLVAVSAEDRSYPGQLSRRLGDEVFLKGRYIEVGVHQVGSFGTAQNPGAGFIADQYVAYTWYGGLGFIADFGRDGFDVGSPSAYSGDYFLPGSPMEGCVPPSLPSFSPV